jgi:hypothetical protein
MRLAALPAAVQEPQDIEKGAEARLGFKLIVTRALNRGLSSSGTENRHKARGPYLPSQQTFLRGIRLERFAVTPSPRPLAS